ncbi:MAG: tetratricopeptide repeat protein [Syntrophales bacterium]|nr:tetratricopeptide repeat protein [Syntrophales bacterium]
MRHLRFYIIFILFFLLTAKCLCAAEYVAFSLKVAQEKIVSISNKDKDYRKVYPDVFTMGGITIIRGLVYDRKKGDVILVGERNKDRAILTLDDFVVALRAKFIHGKWPLVSIDPTKDTKNIQMQIVRFEGGIEDTQFGEDLFDADYRLKQISMGLLPSSITGLKTYWDLGMQRVREETSESHIISSRFWFYPVLPSVSVREDVVAIKGLKVGIFTEVLSAEIDGKKIENLSAFKDPAGDMFAKIVSDNFEGLSQVHPSFLRLQGLDELVALTKAIEEMDKKPDLSFWLMDYHVKEVKTKKEVEVLRRKEEYKLQGAERIYKGYQELSGGVQLMAIALRLKAGDITALREAVLKTKPKPDALSWSFVVGEWLIPTSPEILKTEDVASLFSYAVFLQKNERHEDAITLYEKVIHLKPDWDLPYNNRGLAYRHKGLNEQATKDFDKALEINPMSLAAMNNKGIILSSLGRYEDSIVFFDKALEINPLDVDVWSNKGASLTKISKNQDALVCFDKALNLNQKNPTIWLNKGLVLRELRKHQDAINCFNKALEIDPTNAIIWYNKGKALQRIGNYKAAIESYEKVLRFAPKDSDMQIKEVEWLIQTLKH